MYINGTFREVRPGKKVKIILNDNGESYMMNLPWQKNNALKERAIKSIPLGVNSNFRFWGDNITPYLKKAKGAYLWDADGNKYIDYRMAFGPIILGHAYDEVNEKVKSE